MLPSGGVDTRFGQRPPQRPLMSVEEPPLNFGTFWTILGKLLVRLMKERMHGQVVITLHAGHIPIVEINRKYKSTDLPQV